MDAAVINSRWTFSDYLNLLRVRLSFKRNDYRVNPGIYFLGNPDEKSPVFVTANYKFSFNVVRKALQGIDCYIMVLDTKGINVWCAAGKGTFGTEELIRQIETVNLKDIISHRKIILPQLGAPGMIPPEIKRRTGFNIFYGPVDAADLKKFINAGYSADKKMRTKYFRFTERFAVSLTHFVQGIPLTLLIGIVLSAFDYLVLLHTEKDLSAKIIQNAVLSFTALLTGSILTGILLPFLPGKAFSVKGFFMSVLFFLFFYFALYSYADIKNCLLFSSKLILLSCWIIFQALNLTGSSTYTSLSGVRKEMKYTIPILFAGLISGIALYITGGFII